MIYLVLIELLVYCIFIGCDPISIVAIIDESSTIASMISVHSIIESSQKTSQLSFHFLHMSKNITVVTSWILGFNSCFHGIRMETRMFERPPLLSVLRNQKFEKDVIFARFYLSNIFPNLNKFIYLDNDLIVTADLAELFNNPMIVYPDQFKPIIKNKPAAQHQTTSNILMNRKQSRKLSAMKRAPVGFVFERHPHHIAYIKSNFNMSHPLVKKATSLRSSEYFLNGGVALFDAARWRRENWTAKAEEIIVENAKSEMYSSQIGDQGVFFLLLLDNVVNLPGKFNMRRLPKKSIQQLEKFVQGLFFELSLINEGPHRLV